MPRRSCSSSRASSPGPSTSLPTDVLVHVLELLAARGQRRTLAAFQSTSRELYLIATPLLWRTLDLSPGSGGTDGVLDLFGEFKHHDYPLLVHSSVRFASAVESAHPIELPAAYRLRWLLTLVRRIRAVDRQLDESKSGSRIFAKVVGAIGNELMPAVDSLVLAYATTDARKINHVDTRRLTVLLSRGARTRALSTHLRVTHGSRIARIPDISTAPEERASAPHVARACVHAPLAEAFAAPPLTADRLVFAVQRTDAPGGARHRSTLPERARELRRLALELARALPRGGRAVVFNPLGGLLLPLGGLHGDVNRRWEDRTVHESNAEALEMVLGRAEAVLGLGNADRPDELLHGRVDWVLPDGPRYPAVCPVCKVPV